MRYTYLDYLDLLDHAKDHIQRADSTNPADNVEPLKSAIARLVEALGVAKSGEFATDDDSESGRAR